MTTQFSLLDQPLTLSRVEASVAEHSNLGGDVTPVPGCPELLQPGPQPLSHANDPVRHHLDALLPLAVQGGVLQDGVHDPAAVGGGVGVHGADDESHLGPGGQ